MANNFKKTLIFILLYIFFGASSVVSARETFFQVQSIDTMKFSRDASRQLIDDKNAAKKIDLQIKKIAATGATHVAIDTPYDEEFIPILKIWVDSARKNQLKVWYRGNMSGWEGWFDYPKIDRAEHIKKISDFIVNHPELFEDGDVFTSCPECENGGPGDPRMTRDIDGFRTFLIDEHNEVVKSFQKIKKNVITNYFSMNGDVARLIMDKKTTKALGGTVTIDHYVATPDKLIRDIDEISTASAAKIVLGEFGAPIPDLNGDMTDNQQSDWISDAMSKMAGDTNISAVNYWTNEQSSTSLWREDGTAKPAVDVIKKYYSPINVFGSVTDKFGNGIDNVIIKGKMKSTKSVNGKYVLPVLNEESVLFEKKDYVSISINVIGKPGEYVNRDITMEPYVTPFYWQWIINLFSFVKGDILNLRK